MSELNVCAPRYLCVDYVFWKRPSVSYISHNPVRPVKGTEETSKSDEEVPTSFL